MAPKLNRHAGCSLYSYFRFTPLRLLEFLRKSCMTSQINIRLDDELTRALKRRVKREKGQTASAIIRAALSSYLQHETLAEQSAGDIRAAIESIVESNAQAVMLQREELAPLVALMRDLLARFEADAPSPAVTASSVQSDRASRLLKNLPQAS